MCPIYQAAQHRMDLQDSGGAQAQPAPFTMRLINNGEYHWVRTSKFGVVPSWDVYTHRGCVHMPKGTVGPSSNAS